MSRIGAFVTLARGAVWSAALLAGAAAAQERPSIDGFGVSYPAPGGFALAAKEGRAHAWTPTDGARSALFLFGGAFSPLALAFGDAGSVLEDFPEQEPEMVDQLTERKFGAHDGVAAAFRARGADGTVVLVRIAAVSLGGSATLGGVAIVPADVHAARIAAFEAMDAMLAGARAAGMQDDRALSAKLVGQWRKQSGYQSGGTGGGFIDEESWRFTADGAFEQQRTFTASLPGAAVRPTREEKRGRWRAVGGSLVLDADGETVTLNVDRDGGALVIGGSRFIPR